MAISKENQGGQCFPNAYKYQSEHPEVTLVHGLVTGQGPIKGIVYSHAWCELDDMVIDPTPGITVPKALYYKVGKITDTFKYNLLEKLKISFKTGNYGPWEPKLIESFY
jgi:hypothetical protein